MVTTRRPTLLAKDFVAAVVVLASAGCSKDTDAVGRVGQGLDRIQPYADGSGNLFTHIPTDPFAPPTVQEIQLPDFKGPFNAVWAATGRDDRGHIWFGVSKHKQQNPSAELLEYAPETDLIRNHGNVLDQLRQAGVYRPGEGQMKIHSRILQGNDGLLYFASSDEQGQDDEWGTRLPAWGAHLWRMKPTSSRWQHLCAIPKGVYAIGAAGKWIYLLGYFDHELYQWNTDSRELKSVPVGSIVAHRSRNFVVDQRGHAFVPRVRLDRSKPGSEQVRCSLVEYDESLNEIRETRVEHYFNRDRFKRHGLRLISWCQGIPSFCGLSDGSFVIATVTGYLYQIVPSPSGPAAITPLGWLHPDGELESDDGPGGLFTCSGLRYVMAVLPGPNRTFQWAVFDLMLRRSAVRPLTLPNGYDRSSTLLFGSITRDNQGAFYMGGCCGSGPGKIRPLLSKFTPVGMN